MKKFIAFGCAVCAVLMLAGCASTKKEAVSDNRPTWVKRPEGADSVGWYARGTGVSTNKVLAEKQARLDGRAMLGQRMQSYATSFSKNVIAESGNTSVEIQVGNSEALLNGSYEDDAWEDEDGTIYVKMVLPFENALQNFKSQMMSQVNKSVQEKLSKMDVNEFKSLMGISSGEDSAE